MIGLTTLAMNRSSMNHIFFLDRSISSGCDERAIALE
jgi:hypothetical protein